MNPRFRIKFLALLGLALLTLLNTPVFAQGRGGGGGGRGAPPDPTARYINQLELEGKSKGAFRKAFNTHTRNVQKWSAKLQKFQKKNQKYVGVKTADLPDGLIEKIKADRAVLDAEQKANIEAYKESLAAFLTPQQVKRVDVIAKQIVDQRKKAQARRAANQGNSGGGGGNRKR